ARHTAGAAIVSSAAQPLLPLHLPLRCRTDNEAIGEAVEDLPSFPCIARSSRGIRQVGRGPAAGGTEQPERLTSSALRNTRPTASIPSKAQSMTMPARPAGPFSDRPLIASLAVAALLLTAANLRGGLVVVGPLVLEIRDTLAINASAFSLLTTLPLLCFGVVSIAVPWLSRRCAPQQLAITDLLMISLCISVRLREHYPLLFLCTLLLGSAISLLNVLSPCLVKSFFPCQVALMTGLYSVSLCLGAGLGVYLAVPLMDQFASWRHQVA